VGCPFSAAWVTILPFLLFSPMLLSFPTAIISFSASERYCRNMRMWQKGSVSFLLSLPLHGKLFLAFFLPCLLFSFPDSLIGSDSSSPCDDMCDCSVDYSFSTFPSFLIFSFLKHQIRNFCWPPRLSNYACTRLYRSPFFIVPRRRRYDLRFSLFCSLPPPALLSPSDTSISFLSTLLLFFLFGIRPRAWELYQTPPRFRHR